MSSKTWTHRCCGLHRISAAKCRKDCVVWTSPFLRCTAQGCCSQDRDQRAAAATRSFPVGNVPRSEHAQWCVRGYGRDGEQRRRKGNVPVFAREAENNTGRQATATEQNTPVCVRVGRQAANVRGKIVRPLFFGSARWSENEGASGVRRADPLQRASALADHTTS